MTREHTEEVCPSFKEREFIKKRSQNGPDSGLWRVNRKSPERADASGLRRSGVGSDSGK
jgi:hypothetical protein